MPDTDKPKILAIDDDWNFLDLCRMHLSSDFDVHVACNGKEGIRKLCAIEPSVVLLDLRMPRVSGIQVLEYMQMWPAISGIPVIVVTARYLDERLRNVLASLANIYNAFQKTVPLKKLAAEARGAMHLGRLCRVTSQLKKRIEMAEQAAQERSRVAEIAPSPRGWVEPIKMTAFRGRFN